MRTPGTIGALFVVAVCAALIGCGGEKKADDGGPAPAGPKGKGPDGTPPEGAPAASGEPKFKVASADFIKEFATGGRAASAKYAGAVVELSGPVSRPAALETDDFGMLVGAGGAYKAVLTFGADDAKRSETVVVRGLKPSTVGTIFRGQKVRVKGKVGKYQDPNPVTLVDAEVVDPGTDPSIPLDYKQFYGPNARDYITQFETATARVSGTVVKRGKDVTDYVEIKLDTPDKLRCYLMNGIEPQYPSGFEAGMKVTFVGVMKAEVIDKGTPFAGNANVLRDAVPTHRDPKAPQ